MLYAVENYPSIALDAGVPVSSELLMAFMIVTSGDNFLLGPC